jgi:hypothetical protein
MCGLLPLHAIDGARFRLRRQIAGRVDSLLREKHVDLQGPATITS